ncbi:LysR family transcriptional regulator [Thermophilibacter provencensis]|uniref:LysR family transcriptional regulator n=1 Tax=Thermophilibacter provencensis TaxID=1852386 RepID=A0ABT7V3R3_9ACTN|nr:LysR family transcriptional regulator [Thermophilibacter provencensis]MDM8271243.1 LysR family transcriptional regulator [Thermophilibacter provencensis]
MNIKQLKYVCAIVDSGSFSSAAACEGVSVQAVSKAMAELEGKLGTPLFERMSVGVRPTPFGRAFAARARRVLDEWDSLERFARNSTLGAADVPFRMGFCCPSYSGVEKFCMLISTVTGRVLGRKVEVTLEACSEALDDLRSGKLDGIITVGPVSGDDVVCGALGTIGSCVLFAKGHPLEAKECVTLDDLADYPVLDPTNFEHFHDAVLSAYLAHGLLSEPHEVTTHDTSIEFFTKKNGYTFIVGGNVTGAAEGLVMRPLVPGDALAIPICLTTPKGASSVDFVEFRHALSRLTLFA